MIDSSKWIFNEQVKMYSRKRSSKLISLKEGEAQFIKQGNYQSNMGATVIVMAFDIELEADSYEKKDAEICERSYNILVKEVKFPPQDIIFDPNILPAALLEWKNIKIML